MTMCMQQTNNRQQQQGKENGMPDQIRTKRLWPQLSTKKKIPHPAVPMKPTAKMELEQDDHGLLQMCLSPTFHQKCVCVCIHWGEKT